MSRQSELAELSRVYDSSALSNRNVVINGGFQIFQRATAATAQTDGAYKTADRWLGFVSGGGAYTTQKSTGHLADTGHDTALKIDVTTADTSLGTADYYSIVQRIEAQNLQHFQYGKATAKTITLSFWVRATKTGTSCVTVAKNDSTQYNYVAEYTINASDTWEHKTITIEPNSDIKSASGAIVNDNGRGMQVIFILGYGSNYTGGTANAWNDSADFATTNQVNHMDSTSNDFYITGVQLEVGDSATPFEHRSYGQELQLCQRYYWNSYNGAAIGSNTGTTTAIGKSYATGNYGTISQGMFPVTMRAQPTIVAYNPITGSSGSFRGDSSDFNSVSITFRSVNHFQLNSGNLAVGDNVYVSTHVTADAEL